MRDCFVHCSSPPETCAGRPQRDTALVVYPAALGRALHVLPPALPTAAVGLSPTMAAAVVKLIGPDMPTSGLHVLLETVSTHVEKATATHLMGSHAALADGRPPQLATLASLACLHAHPARGRLWAPVGALVAQ